MTNAMQGKNLRRDRIIAWFVVILSVVALATSRPKNPLILLLLFFSLLGSLVWILVIGFLLRRTKVHSQRIRVLARPFLMGIFGSQHLSLLLLRPE
jgi:hypothetical protein